MNNCQLVDAVSGASWNLYSNSVSVESSSGIIKMKFDEDEFDPVTVKMKC